MPTHRFPATFTFVVRSFTVLDGIGKSLDARFDISEIAAPYARDLLLEGSPQVCVCVCVWQSKLFLSLPYNPHQTALLCVFVPCYLEGTGCL
jgi:hypothetical protein